MKHKRPLQMPYVSFGKDTNPKQPMRHQPCAGCAVDIWVNTERPDSYRAMCPDCGDKLLAGTLESLTFYRGDVR